MLGAENRRVIESMLPLRNQASIRRLVRGDKNAWDAFVDRFSPVIYSAVSRVFHARSRAASEWDVRDVVQSIFIRLVKDDYRLLKTYDPSRASLVTWLTIVGRSAALDFLRRRTPEMVPLDERALQIAAPPVVPLLPLALPPQALAPRQELVLHLVYDQGMTAGEVAALLGVDAQTVRSAKHKALKRLRRIFKNEE